ncbi:MAG: hypothetical protein A2X35_09035 [Elusimicrobia bacterium GWA2_61_42]|nr:MAG: hypothetical protein A2X35_09035 [Elusimicrobia bacterium GWA2_61_42]OGR75727.1 MAG: hypothetical protein A2X38_06980 [Elusimicrobia bacterium GWC2_61_25]
MGLKNYYSEMKAVRDEVTKATWTQELRVPLGEGLAGFWARTKFSVRLIFLEKEIITFALLQWACIALGYYLWVQMIGWIPEAAWERAASSDKATIGDFILFLWSFFCVGIVAFPLGILNGCMGAAHFLNRQGKESTIDDCLKMVLPRAWPLWLFHWIDGWWTVLRILDRLPKKRDRRSPADKAKSEAMYYAWKLATIGILPGLVTGRGLVDAGKRSVELVVRKFKTVIILRGGYSALCWVVGVGGYIGSIAFFINFPGLVNFKAPVAGQIYVFYCWVGIPLLISAGLVMLLLRPIYVISSCDIYADYVAEQQENLMLPPPPAQARGYGAVIAAALLGLAILAAAFYREELGLMRLLAQ